MSNLPAVQMTEQGLLLPRQLFESLGEIKVVQKDDCILIKPKNMTARFEGFVRSRIPVEQLHQDYELSLLEGNAL
jgi:hypothetical protein